MTRQAQLTVAVLLLAAAVVAPFLIGNYWLRVMTTVFMYAVVAQGLNVIVGFAGYHSFGNSAFFGVGAYACGVAMAQGVPALIAAPLGTLAAAATAGILGWPLLRLRGHYFAIATVALNMALIEVIINVGGLTGGAQGLPLPISPIGPDLLYRIIYFAMLGAAIFEIFATLIWSNFTNIHNMLLGALVVIIVLVLPNGVMDTLSRFFARPGSAQVRAAKG
jgi:branched-chain amino acid transport system permease protein